MANMHSDWLLDGLWVGHGQRNQIEIVCLRMVLETKKWFQKLVVITEN